MKQLPDELQVPLVLTNIWSSEISCPTHETKCTIPHSFNFMPGVGRTDSKGIEQNWSKMNCVANSTKEMGPASRHDTLSDHFGHHNWRKYTTFGEYLLVAIVERDRQQGALEEFNAAIEECDNSQPNPYINLTEAQVHTRLAKEEKAGVIDGTVHPHETSPSGFVMLALRLEESHNSPEPEPEEITLWLPSEVNAQSRTTMCATGLVDIEVQLREVQCHNALDKLRSHLHTKSHYIRHRNINIQVAAAAAKYNCTCNTLLVLKSPGSWEVELRPLHKSDITTPNGDDISVKRAGNNIGAYSREKSNKQLMAQQRGLGEGYKMISWIRTTTGVLGDGTDSGLNDALRIEWAKARTRALQETCCIHQYLHWKSAWWEARQVIPDAESSPRPDLDLAEGISAYTLRQSAVQRALCDRFTELWENPDVDKEGLTYQAAIEEADEEDEGDKDKDKDKDDH
ncbi:hypothetical protein BV22DRAFT_1108395 [Leucogyrophana mollusca]|uniref:Uncharacterized protein n=1 Tax=Leucogyrophana mollusca TaxID=85980 RepID=A0ACB8AYB4_9AGAM|nr:hypothetical protein BV22DRAFT_1108395 [Leucogyrophana mollusca]